MTGQTDTDYSPGREPTTAKLRGEQLLDKPARTRRYHVPADAARTIAALLTIRDHVITPILAGIRTPRRGRRPATWTSPDRDNQTLLSWTCRPFVHDLGIATEQAAA